MSDKESVPAKPKRGRDVTGGKRQNDLLQRLQESGGKPIRVDTHGPDIALIDELIANGYATSRTEVYRKAMREAHARMMRRLSNKKA